MSLFACLFIAWSVPNLHADDDAKKEHATAESDHIGWLKQLRTMRAEHRRALSALKRLEAEILEHEAELEEQIAEIEEHRQHIHAHEDAIESGSEKLDKKHAELEKRHQEIARAMKSSDKHHKELISGLMKFVKDHISKFHTHSDE